MATPQRLLLIDGYSSIFRAFHAIRDLSNSKGLPTNAVYGFVTMLRKLLREQEPDLVGIALDVSDDTVRKARYEAYKANREPMPEALAEQIPWIRRAIEAYGIPILELASYEADDVLGTLARQAAERGYEVTLVSADKDLTQLVGPRVRLLHTGRDKLYDAARVEEDFGVPPAKIPDVLALKGDAVDNVPGVPGIGDKGARTLINEFGSLETLLERAAEVQRKSYRKGLEEHREEALLSKELTTIHTDLPLVLDEAALEYTAPDTDKLRSLFKELEFFSLLEELGGGRTSVEATVAEELEDVEAWERMAAELPSERYVVLLGEPPLGLAVGGSEGPVRYADFRRAGVRAAVMATVAGWIEESGGVLVGHDLKEVLRFGGAPRASTARLADTLIVSYLLRSTARAPGLAELALERLGHRALSAEEAGWTKGLEPPLGCEPLRHFAGERVELLRRLRPELEGQLAGSLGAVYREIEEPLIPVLVAMEEAGVLLDVGFLESMSEELAGAIASLEEEIYDLAGERFNINSPKQLRVILFQKLGYPVGKKTRKTKSYSTSADTLQELADEGFDLPKLLLRYRELTKLKSTYVDALPGLVGEDGRLHTRYNQLGAATGRISSNNPNLQNIPIRTQLGQRIRRAFVAAPEHVLITADYSQIELRVLAHIAEEPRLREAFRRGEDIHAATAAAVFGGSPALVAPEQRRAAKVINFGIIYGMSPFGLARNLGISSVEAARFIDAYLERYEGVKRYMEETLACARAEGKVETLYGRVRWLPDINSKNRNLRENAQRMAINARIQGTAADLLKKAMVVVDGRLCQEFPDARLLLTVHDELVLEVPEAAAEKVGDLVRQAMEGVATLSVPLVVDVGSGPTWYDAKR